MFEIRPNCEHCNKDLPNESTEALICTFECTFCVECVTTIFNQVCPNCGSGFEKRPIRPVNLLQVLLEFLNLKKFGNTYLTSKLPLFGSSNSSNSK